MEQKVSGRKNRKVDWGLHLQRVRNRLH